jgi:hypothetical protein
MENLTSLLKKNTDLRKKYVAAATVVADVTAKGLNKLVRHLLVVQDIDPNTQPGSREYQLFSQQLNDLFDGKTEINEYTGPRDEEAWFQKHLAKAQGKFSHLDKEAYKKLTDLSHVPDRKEEETTDPLQVALSNGTVKEVMESSTPVYTADDQDKIAKLAALSQKPKEVLPVPAASLFNKDGSFDFTALKDALHTLRNYASKLEDEEPKEKVYVSRANAAVGSRRFPTFVKVTREFKGNFRRVEEEKK